MQSYAKLSMSPNVGARNRKDKKQGLDISNAKTPNTNNY